VWFTVADGVLSDTYSPTTDNSNLSTLQYLVTDGHSFTDLQTRDMTYVARALDGTGMTVSGTTAPGASVVVAATLSPAGATDPGGTAHTQPIPTSVRQVTAAPDGAFSVTVPAAAGSDVVSVAAAKGAGTGRSQQTVTVTG
jgi:hypothetical protein